MVDLYTKVVSAEVFRGGAEVVRRGSAELAAGVQTIRVPDLTRGAQTDSIRVYSQSGISCSNLRFVSQYADGKEPAEIKQLQEKIAELEDHIEIRNIQKDMWKANGNFSSRTEQPVSEVQEYIDSLAERLESINSDILSANKEIEELQSKLEKAREKAAAPILLVDIESAAAGEFPFEIKYFEVNASWRPVYELHSDGEGPLSLRMKANITQYSGEDWQGIDISLLSGNPSASGSVPVVSPVFLDFKSPELPMYGAGKAKAMSMNMAFAARAMDDTAVMEESAMDAAPMVMMQTAGAKVSSDEASTRYVLPGKRDVASGGDGTVADIQTTDIPAEYRIVTVPRADQSAYLVASVKPSDVPSHSGMDLSVYYKDVYTGKVWLDPDFTDEETEITLGKEERIHVTRKEVMRKTSTALFKGQKVTEYAYETRISNTSGKAADLVIKDQVPVSQNKDITVEITELSGAEHDKETGILTRKLRLESEQTEVLRLSYKVAFPKDKKIEERR